MQKIAVLPETENSRNTFYPTPPTLADKLLAGIDWVFVESVLEPSAGKGDLAEAVKTKWRAGYKRWVAQDYEFDLDCVELDGYLRAILKDRGFRVVNDDFLSFRTCKRYSLIVMNPPFDKGAKHLLKALQMQERGGAVYCICNAETLQNPYTYERQQLVQKLKQYEAEIEYLQDGFRAAERKTTVAVALVRVHIPYVLDEGSSILNGLRKDVASRREVSPPDQQALAKGDYTTAAVDRYNYELDAAMRLIQEYKAIEPLLKNAIDPDDRSSGTVMQLVVGTSIHKGGETATENKVIQLMRKKYWKALFQNPLFTKDLTSNLKEELDGRVESMKDYDFSEYNIRSLRYELHKRLIKGVEETIMALFDDWTRKYHYDENSQNRHYFDGWRTNDAFAVNKKVIIPFYGVYSDWGGDFKPTAYRIGQKMSDIENVFRYLDCANDENYSVDDVLRRAEESGQTRKVQFSYFMATFYKKGTCHIEFTNFDVLKKFNLFAARGKNWLPPCYGKKRYRDMSAEEKAVVDSYEGETSYTDTLNRANYFLGEVRPIGLMDGNA